MAKNDADEVIQSQNGDNEGAADKTVEPKEDEGADKGNEPDKQPESDEAKLARLERQIARLRKKTGKGEEKSEPKKQANSDEFGYGELAYLNTEGIKTEKEHALLRKIMAETGKSLKDVVNSKYVQAELKEMREAEASAEAVNAASKAGKRTGQSPKGVDYWLNRDFSEVPDGMRREVLNAKINKAKEGSKFSSNPVIKGV